MRAVRATGLERDATPADDRTPEEKASGVARMTACLANLPPDLAKFYEALRRLDPKGKPREK